MNRRGPIVASSAFYLLTIALFIFHIEILLNRGCLRGRRHLLVHRVRDRHGVADLGSPPTPLRREEPTLALLAAGRDRPREHRVEVGRGGLARGVLDVEAGDDIRRGLDDLFVAVGVLWTWHGGDFAASEGHA